MHAATRLSSHGRALEAVAQAKGAAGVSAALAGAAALAPPDLSEAYAAGLDGRALDSARLLVLARGGLESLNAASRAGCSEVSDFMTRALQSSGLFALVFRDAREAQAAVVLRLCDETVAAFELSSRRAAQTVTRPVKLGAMIRTVFTRPDGEPLHSFVLFEEENKALINGFIETFSAETCPRSAFALYVETHISPGKAASESDVARARLGERAIAAASEAYVALLSVVTHLIGLDHLPSLIARIRVLAAAADMTPRELEGLFLTLGHHQIGVAALMVISTLGSSGPAFSRMLESGGLANVLVAASNPALDEPSLNGCLIVLAFACGHSKSIAQALVDKGAFTLLQHAIRHDNVAVAVRASFAVASLAVSCDGAAEPLRWSGALDAIATALRAIGLGSAVIPGFLIFSAQSVAKLLLPGVEPALQLAALHRLSAALSGTTSNSEAIVTAPLVASLRCCAASRDALVSAAARYVLKELRQPAQVPCATSDTAAASLDSNAAARTPRNEELAIAPIAAFADDTEDAVRSERAESHDRSMSSFTVLQPSSAAWHLTAHWSTLAALTQAKGAAAVVAAALAGASFSPRDLCSAFAAGLDSTTLDSPRLLTAVRRALDSLNAASHAGSDLATTFLSSALLTGPLFALVFRDVRVAQAAVAQHLCSESMAAFELACRRAAMTVTRPVKPGFLIRTTFTRANGTPLHSFVLGKDCKALLDGITATVTGEPCPLLAFRLYAETRVPTGEAASEATLARSQLGERFLAAASESYIALVTVIMHTCGLGIVPTPYLNRLCNIVDESYLTDLELEGLFPTFGRDQIGVAALTMIAVFAASGTVFSRILDLDSGVDGLARLLAMASNPALDNPSLNGSLIMLTNACAHSERLAQALVDKGAFTLLQPVMRHDNVIVAVRACFVVGSIAVSCQGSAEPLRWSGALDVITSVLRPLSFDSALITGFLTFILPTILKLLQPGVEPALQLASLHRLCAGLTGTTSIIAHVTTEPVLTALRACAASPDAYIASAAQFALKELQQPLELRAIAPAPLEAATRAAAAVPARWEPSEGKGDETLESMSAGLPTREEGATRGMLAEILTRGTITSDMPWPFYCRSSISDVQLDALASIGAVSGYGAPIRPVALPEDMVPLFLSSTRAALVRYGIIE